MKKGNYPLGKNKLPPALSLRKLIGPSFIILGLGLGSGEVILWPFLSSNFGLGIMWGALVGITIQFFINMEVERYALINGESIFVGFGRLMKWLPMWFIFTTFLGFGWPGIGLAGANLLSTVFGISSVRVVGVILFLIIGMILTFGKTLYKTVESLQKYLIMIGVPFIFLITIYIARTADYVALGKGLVGQGDGFAFLPAGIVLMTFLGALAYSGAGGNLNLAQSFYVRDKGYGMGKYAQKITGLFRAKKEEEIKLTGSTFTVTEKSLAEYKKWWKIVNIEHALVFWGLGLFTMCMLALLAYSTTYGLGDNGEGIQFVINEALVIARETFPLLGSLFLLVTGIMLSATQLTVLDSTSRIMTENVLLLTGTKKGSLSKWYYVILWIQIIFGITVFLSGFDQPVVLITLGAVINAMAMFVYIGLLLIVNNTMLDPRLRPSLFRNMAMTGAFIFFGVFSTLTLYSIFFG